MKEFKIRCSAIAQIMGFGKDARPITTKQLERITELDGKEKLTDKQASELIELRSKRDKKPTIDELLPVTAQTWLKKWVKEQLYERRKEFYSKYTDKGISVEQDSIDYLAENLKWGFVLKNEKYFENNHMTGSPDVFVGKWIKEVKNSWDFDTFPLFDTEPNPDHVCQVQGYMALTGAESAEICYVLMDMPEHLIQKMVYAEASKLGVLELDNEMESEIREQYLYSKLPPHLRIKRFIVHRDNDFIQSVNERVEVCRKYIETLLPVVDANKEIFM